VSELAISPDIVSWSSMMYESIISYSLMSPSFYLTL
jgi:hypothetical protein